MPRTRLPACILILLMVVFASASADTVVLKDGTSVTGKLVGRENIKPGAECPGPVSIVETSGIVREFAFDDVSYVLLDGADGPTIVTAGSSSGAAAGKPKVDASGVGEIGFGVLWALVGATVPFGRETVDLGYGASLEMSYFNDFNRGMVIGGILCVGYGTILAVTHPRPQVSGAPTVEPMLAPISGGPAVELCLRF